MSTVLALLSSVLWGSADFLGGNLSKRFTSLAVTGSSQAVSLIFGAVLVVVSGGWVAPNLRWDGYVLPGIFAGIAGFLGLIAFYAALSSGRMGVVSPISSLSALIPLAVAYLQGERPKILQLVGMAIALIGAFCSSGPEARAGSIKPLLLAICAAIGFGTALAFMAVGSRTSPLMTMTTMRCLTVSVCVLLAISLRSVGSLSIREFPILIAIGVTDFLANLFLGVATTKGLVSVAMVLGSLFPIMTALLAFKFLHERLHKVQYLGIFFAIFGVALISIA